MKTAGIVEETLLKTSNGNQKRVAASTRNNFQINLETGRVSSHADYRRSESSDTLSLNLSLSP
jgi:hypothetical protein